MQFALLPASDASFRVLTLLMAGHPRYANMPFARALDVHTVLRKRHVWAAIDSGDLKGAMLWSEFADTVGVQSIASRKLPDPKLELASGQAVVVLSIIAPREDMRGFWDAFVRHQGGKLIMYERTFEGRPPHFSWVDRDGRKDGPNV